MSIPTKSQPVLTPRQIAAIEFIERKKKEVEAMSDEELAENEQIHRNIDAERPEGQKLFPELHAAEAK
jgi:hypothetical protein